MSIFLEHDDLKKSRRALLAVSFLVISLDYIELKSNTLTLLGLSVSVYKENLIVAGKWAVIYLLVVLVVHFVDFISRALIERSDRMIDSYREGLLKLSDRSGGAITEKELELLFENPIKRGIYHNFLGMRAKELKDAIEIMEKVDHQRARVIVVSSLIRDALIPLLVAFMALTHFHRRLADLTDRFLLSPQPAWAL